MWRATVHRVTRYRSRSGRWLVVPARVELFLVHDLHVRVLSTSGCYSETFGVDLVVADPEVAVDERDAGGGGLGAAGVGLGWGASVQRAVRAGGVGVGGEVVELGLQLGEGGRGLGSQPLLLGWWKRSTLPQVCGW